MTVSDRTVDRDSMADWSQSVNYAQVTLHGCRWHAVIFTSEKYFAHTLVHR